jgi:prepilin-type N-terminal cleavage/methylation domain-containing protein
MKARLRPQTGEKFVSAFTLVEMLVVMAVIAVIVSLTGPVMTSLQDASNINRAVYDISGLFTQARAYALSNNTYVYVGITEIDPNQSASTKPRKAGVGKIVLAVIASRDGTSGYTASDVSTTWPQAYNANRFFLIGKAQAYDNLHLVDLGQRPDSGTMARPPYNNSDPIAPKANLGNTACISATPFAYPVGAAADSVDYAFTKVIQFSPQGVARIQMTDNSDIVAPWLEMGLQQSHGTAAPALQPPVKTGAVAAIQINGVTGATRIYRP